VSRGLIIEVRDARGNIVPPTWIDKAAANGIRFHRHPDGPWIATAGARRVFGLNQEETAGLMLVWIEWENRGRPT
jgi:hypothetical protein